MTANSCLMLPQDNAGHFHTEDRGVIFVFLHIERKAAEPLIVRSFSSHRNVPADGNEVGGILVL